MMLPNGRRRASQLRDSLNEARTKHPTLLHPGKLRRFQPAGLIGYLPGIEQLPDIMEPPRGHYVPEAPRLDAHRLSGAHRQVATRSMYPRNDGS